jgi:hypothetical protein
MHRRRPAPFLAALALALASPPSAAGQMWLQFSTALGGGSGAQRIYLYLDGDRVPGGDETPEPAATTSPASPAVVGVPLLVRGPYVPNVVFEARNRATAGYAGDLRRLCRLRPLSCALSGYAFAGSPLLDLGLYRTDDRRSASHRLAP